MDVKIQRINEAKGFRREAYESKNCLLYRGPLTLHLEPFFLPSCLKILASPHIASSTSEISQAQRAFGFGYGGIPFASHFQNSYDLISINTVKDMIT